MPFTHYQQHDQMDCGPTCLRMVAKHHGRAFSIQKLREATQIGKEGVSLLGISEAAESIGFKTLAVKVPFKQLENDAPLPCIVHWKQNPLFALMLSNVSLILKSVLVSAVFKTATENMFCIDCVQRTHFTPTDNSITD